MIANSKPLNSTDSAFICIEMNSIVIFAWHSTCDQCCRHCRRRRRCRIQMKSKIISKSNKFDQTEPISLSDSNSECEMITATHKQHSNIIHIIFMLEWISHTISGDVTVRCTQTFLFFCKQKLECRRTRLKGNGNANYFHFSSTCFLSIFSHIESKRENLNMKWNAQYIATNMRRW